MIAEQIRFELARRRRLVLLLQFIRADLSLVRTLVRVAERHRRSGMQEESNRLKVEAACACLRLLSLVLRRRKYLPGPTVRRLLLSIDGLWQAIAAI